MSRQRITKGAVIQIGRRTFTVVDVEPADIADAGPSAATWPDHLRNDPIRVGLHEHGEDAEKGTLEAVVPRQAGHLAYRDNNPVKMVAPADDEGHWAACSSCGEPWPCNEIGQIRHAERRADALLARIEHEDTHRWPCTWCGRFSSRGSPPRFKTERGMKQHLRGCDANPSNWDTGRWLHRFDEHIKIVGGVDPLYLLTNEAAGEPGVERHFGVNFGSLDELAALNRAVQQAAIDGTLPDRLDQLKV